MISRCQVLKLFVICALLTITTNFPSGFTNSSINTAVRELTRFINESYSARDLIFTEVEQTLIRSAALNCWYVAQIFGFIFAPFLTDRFGRKVSYMFAALGMMTAGIMQFAATLLGIPELLIIGRGICAFCSPISDASLILYLQECSPLEMRGAFSFMCEVGYSSMCLLGMILGMRTVLGDWLPRLLGVSVIPQFFFLIFLSFLPETPKYLMIIRNDRVGALKSLHFFQGEQKEHKSLVDKYAKEAADEGGVKGSSLKEVLGTWYLREAVILAVLVMVLTLPFFPVLQSSTFFFTQAHIPSEIAELSSTILMVLLASSSATGSLFVDRFPRRVLLFTFASLSTFFLLLFVMCSVLSDLFWWMKYVSLGCMAFYIITYAVVVGPMSWFIGPELVPQRHRATVFCFCFTICNILIAVTNFSSVPLYEKFGPMVFVPLFIVPSTLALVYLFLYLPETRNREPHEIISAMKRRKAEETGSYKKISSNLAVY